MVEIKPIHTTIEKNIQTMHGRVILENPKGFPRGESNLYVRTEAGDLLWQAEKPESSSLFTRVRLNPNGKTLSVYTSTGQACEIDLKSGAIISQTNIK